MKLVIFAQVPPPYHDQSVAVQHMLDFFGGDRRRSGSEQNPTDRYGIECYHVNTGFEENPGEVDAGRVLSALFCCMQALWCRFWHGAEAFYYVPSSGKNGAIYFDWLVLFLCRPFFKRTIFHWRNAGLAKCLEITMPSSARALSYFLMKHADLSIVDAEDHRGDAEKFFPLRLATFPENETIGLAAAIRDVRGNIPLTEFPGAPTAPLKLALTILSENPSRKTGLTSMYHELVSRSLKLFPDVAWVIFAGPNQEWTISDPRVKVIRDFPANDKLNQRILADHFLVPGAARKHGAQALLTVGFIPTRKTLPTVLHVLSLQTLDKRNQLGLLRAFYRNSMIKYSWTNADLVITNSGWTKDRVLSIYPQFKDRMIVSYEGLQHEIFNPRPVEGEAENLKKKFNLSPGYLLWVSNFYPYKQAELLIAGYARLDPELRKKHPLIMVGGNWFQGIQTVREKAKSCGIENDVRCLDWVDDAMLAPLYRHAAAFCLASREETFGRCVIEAMACGTPCVVNDIPVMHEITGGHALIVDFQNTDVVAKALKEILTDDKLIARLSRDGIERTQEFTFEKLATERINAIRQLVASHSARN